MRPNVLKWIRSLEPGTIFDKNDLPEGVKPQMMCRYVRNGYLRVEPPPKKWACRKPPTFIAKMTIPKDIYGPSRPSRTVLKDEVFTADEIVRIFGRDAKTITHYQTIERKLGEWVPRPTTKWVKK